MNKNKHAPDINLETFKMMNFIKHWSIPLDKLQSKSEIFKIKLREISQKIESSKKGDQIFKWF